MGPGRETGAVRIAMIRVLMMLAFGLMALGCRGDQKLISLATGGSGAVYYLYGGALAELINRELPAYRATAEVTSASVENVALVVRGQSDFGFGMADTIYQAYTGQGGFAQRPQPSLRALACLYPNVLQVVVLEDGPVQGYGDLLGKTISIGAPGSGTAITAEAVIQALGLPKDQLTLRRFNFNETANALRDGDLQAGFWCVAPPTGSVLELASSRAIRLLSLTQSELAKLLEESPAYVPHRMTPGTYPGLDTEVQTVSVPNLIVVDESLDEELVYEVTKLLYENREHLMEVHPSARFITPEYTLEVAPIPLHPGAVRYLESAGYQVPDRLLVP